MKWLRRLYFLIIPTYRQLVVRRVPADDVLDALLDPVLPDGSFWRIAEDPEWGSDETLLVERVIRVWE